MAFHVVLLLTAVGFRRNANFQLFLLFLACESFVPSVITKHALHMSKYIVAGGKEYAIPSIFHSKNCLVPINL
jgi:hypothetical protein